MASRPYSFSAQLNAAIGGPFSRGPPTSLLAMSYELPAISYELKANIKPP